MMPVGTVSLWGATLRKKSSQAIRDREMSPLVCWTPPPFLQAKNREEAHAIALGDLPSPPVVVGDIKHVKVNQ